MAKRENKGKAGQAVKPKASADKEKTSYEGENPYWWSMSYAPKIDQGVHWLQLVPVVLFAAVVVMITRMANYTRPMEQFFWTNSGNDLTDFFSYYKMIGIIICGVLALLFLAYRLCTQSLAIKYSVMYIPMAVYALCVLLSYAFSDYKEFALLGWNDRFEGTLVLLAYIIMLFYIINSINTVKAVKAVLYSIAVSSSILGVLGITQALDHDFFRTAIGQKLIVPNGMTESGMTVWEMIDAAAKAGGQFLSFTFQNKEIYQTVYNINYVSFYLTLLIPIFGLLFIKAYVDRREASKAAKAAVAADGEASKENVKLPPVWKIILLGALFALLIYNLIGSASSGGFLGMFAVVVVAVIIANKRIIHWITPLAILIVITLIIGGITFDRWSGEIIGAVKSATTTPDKTTEEPAAEKPATIDELAASIASENESAYDGHGKVDYMITDGNDITISYLGEEVIFTTTPDSPTTVYVHDGDGNSLELAETNVSPIYKVNDERFELITIRPAKDEDDNAYVVIGTVGDEWPFRISDDGVKYMNGLGNLVSLHKVPAGFLKDNPGFGTGRGYIWSRTFPMMEKTVLLGHGADTYCIYYPQEDYVGKYNSPNYGSKIDIIVDKPHNLYMGMWVGTGGISVIAFLAMAVLYIIQTVRVYRGRRYDSFLDFAGVGIFLGIMGFLVTGLVDDSSVSVMPMFYGLLGTGVAINMMLAKDMPKKVRNKKEKKNEDASTADVKDAGEVK